MVKVVNELEDILRISYYKEIAVLNDAHNIMLVQHTETSKTYIKKVLSMYNKKVYEQIAANPISGIPRIIDICESNGNLVIIEEYISGRTLLELIEECGSLPEEDVIKYTEALCDILNSLHSLTPPIIHRDIKPSNIMLTEDKRIILLDLNGAKQENPEEAKDTHLIGTHGFAAPEQYGFGASSIQTDLYGTGILMTVLLTGSIEGRDKCPKAFRRVIDKCTRLDSKERYESALQLKKAVASIKRNNKRFLIPCCAVILFLLAGLLIYFLYSPEIQTDDGNLTAGRDSEPADIPADVPADIPTDIPTDIPKDIPGEYQVENVASPVGVYSGNDGEILVISENGKAYYYCYDVAYTELECPWTRTDNILSITFGKTHCTVTADLGRGCEELILKSDSLSWNSEVFENIHKVPEDYIIAPPSFSEKITVASDGTMKFSMDNIDFTVPRQYIDLGNDGRDYYIFADMNQDLGYHSTLLFAEMKEISASDLKADYKSEAEKFTKRFMDNLQIGYSEEISLAGRDAYSVTVSGLLNEGFGGIMGSIYSGRTVLVPREDSEGAVVLFMVQLIGAGQDNSGLFTGIINSASENRADGREDI